MQIFTEHKAEEFLEREGFPVVQRRLFNDYVSAFNYAKRIGFPVVLKLASDKLLNKTEVNAVRLNVNSENFLREFMNLITMKIEKQGVMVQKFINGKFVILGIKKDPTFGHVIVAGIGGIFAEVIKDVSFRILPINKKEALEMLKELKGHEILTSYREEKIGVKQIIEVMLKISKIAKKYPEISELDINPLIVNANNANIVDARIVFE